MELYAGMVRIRSICSEPKSLPTRNQAEMVNQNPSPRNVRHIGNERPSFATYASHGQFLQFFALIFHVRSCICNDERPLDFTVLDTA